MIKCSICSFKVSFCAIVPINILVYEITSVHLEAPCRCRRERVWKMQRLTFCRKISTVFIEAFPQLGLRCSISILRHYLEINKTSPVSVLPSDVWPVDHLSPTLPQSTHTSAISLYSYFYFDFTFPRTACSHPPIAHGPPHSLPHSTLLSSSSSSPSSSSTSSPSTPMEAFSTLRALVRRSSLSKPHKLVSLRVKTR